MLLFRKVRGFFLSIFTGRPYLFNLFIVFSHEFWHLACYLTSRVTLFRLMGSNSCFFRLMAVVFPVWRCSNAHLKNPDQQTAKSFAFIGGAYACPACWSGNPGHLNQVHLAATYYLYSGLIFVSLKKRHCVVCHVLLYSWDGFIRLLLRTRLFLLYSCT